uniref:Uncharacterized protein n=1 Tax=Anguilla anguilla TaxID=7936 RepID=A0A0E9X731_ANGAN
MRLFRMLETKLLVLSTFTHWRSPALKERTAPL